MTSLRTSVAILLLVVAPLAPASTAAQSESPEARELASLTRPSSVLDGVYVHAAKTGTVPIKTGLEGSLGRELTEEESRRLEEIFLRVAKETMPPSDFEAEYVDLLGRYYSVQEMKDLVAFYRTPLGAKVLRFSSVSNEANSAGIHRMMAARQREFVERFTAEFTREFPALNLELERKRRR
jgi:hypothetical protein